MKKEIYLSASVYTDIPLNEVVNIKYLYVDCSGQFEEISKSEGFFVVSEVTEVSPELKRYDGINSFEPEVGFIKFAGERLDYFEYYKRREQNGEQFKVIKLY